MFGGLNVLDKSACQPISICSIGGATLRNVSEISFTVVMLTCCIKNVASHSRLLDFACQYVDGSGHQ